MPDQPTDAGKAVKAQDERDAIGLIAGLDCCGTFTEDISEHDMNSIAQALAAARAEGKAVRDAELEEMRHRLCDDTNPDGKTILDFLNVWLDQERARRVKAEAAVEQARAEGARQEREACAKWLDELAEGYGDGRFSVRWLAGNIRAGLHTTVARSGEPREEPSR